MSDYVGLSRQPVRLESDVAKSASDGYDSCDSVVRDRAAGGSNAVYFVRIGRLVVLRESLSLPVRAQHRASVANIRHVQHVFVIFPPDDGRAGSCAAVLAVKHAYLLVQLLVDVLHRLVNILIFGMLMECPAHFDGKLLRAVLCHLSAAVAVEYREQAAVFVAVNLISVAARILLTRSEPQILVRDVRVFFNANRVLNMEEIFLVHVVYV